MEIAIVDDEAEVRRELEQVLRQYFKKHYPRLLPALSFLKFSNAEDFLPLQREHEFALIFLDIYMDEMTGMDAARELRLQGIDAPIIFLTTSTEHQLDGYRVFASGYLMKPLSANLEVLTYILDHCMPVIVARAQQLAVQVGVRPARVSFNRIFYIDCNNARTAVVHLAKEPLVTSNTYQTCLEQLQDDERFMECYHHVLVNMECIDLVVKDTFLLKNGESIPISRRKHHEVRQHYLHYLSTDIYMVT